MSLTDGASLFTAFLKKEFSHENIEFWTEVENYKKSKPSRLTAKAKKIFSEYIAVKAAKEVSAVSHSRIWILLFSFCCSFHFGLLLMATIDH